MLRCFAAVGGLRSLIKTSFGGRTLLAYQAGGREGSVHQTLAGSFPGVHLPFLLVRLDHRRTPGLPYAPCALERSGELGQWRY
ncbi:hypothetical protein TNCV_2277101 [Trichonephila clavipes]|nr:hypothetical protein TNCV_2277101 [Trichonephila clavipes]